MVESDRTSSSLKEMNLVRVISGPPPWVGGSFVHAIELAKRIDPFLGNQILIAPYSERNGHKQEFPAPSSLRVIFVEYPDCLAKLSAFGIPVVPLIDLRYAVRVRDALQQLPCSGRRVIHVHGILVGALLAVLLNFSKTRVPVIVTQDSGNPFRVSTRSALNAILALVVAKVGHIRHVLVVDDGMGAESFRRILSKMKIKCTIVNHAIEIPRRVEQEDVGSRVFTVLSTSRLAPFKRVDLAVESFAKFLRLTNTKNARLIIAGDGPESEKLKTLVEYRRLSDFVHFVGEKTPEEVQALLDESDVLIATSLKSNLNLSVLEAMAHGKAVITFDCGETRKMMDNMKEGVLVENGNTSAMADALSLLYSDVGLRREIGRRAQARVSKERGWGSRLEAELACYRSCIDSYMTRGRLAERHDLS